MLQLPRFSVGVGDRFAREGEAQLAAFIKIKAQGVTVAPVWNKSFREHSTIHSEPMSARVEADAAVKALGWKDPYFVDADHIGQKTVDGFLAAADFYTLDVADFIGKPSADAEIAAFAAKHTPASGLLTIPGIAKGFPVTKDQVESVAKKYLFAVKEAGRIYQRIEAAKGKGNFVTEVSMDETDKPQTPLDLWFILAALADEGIPLHTIAPKFSGRFNKGVDFVGDLAVFEKEFNDDLLVIAHAVKQFGLPANLKLSVHSGSDKFSIYGPIRTAIERHNAGLHLKTAGTTWLEEVTGLAEAGPEGLALAKEIYTKALGRYDELAAPYATVIDIDAKKLPTAAEMQKWTSRQFVDAVTHDQKNPGFNPSLRQLLHVGYKVAAELGPRYLDALEANKAIVGRRVTANLYENHLVPLFAGRP
jgi:hypothetical protein